MRRQGQEDSPLPDQNNTNHNENIQQSPRAFSSPSHSLNSSPQDIHRNTMMTSHPSALASPDKDMAASSTTKLMGSPRSSVPPSSPPPAAESGGPASTSSYPTQQQRQQQQQPRQRIPNRVFDYRPQDLFLALAYCQEDVQNAIDATKVDKYLEHMARRQLGDDYVGGDRDQDGGGGGGYVFGGGNDDDTASQVGGKSLSFADKHLNGVAGTKGAAASPMYGPAGVDGGEPPINGDIAPYVRPPKRLNRYTGFIEVLEIYLPFGIIIPMAVLCAILIGYMFAKVRLCGYGCECNTSDIALITFTFGLIRDLPCSVVFACLTEACIEHQRSAAQTTLNRKNRQNEGGRSLAAAAAASSTTGAVGSNTRRESARGGDGSQRASASAPTRPTSRTPVKGAASTSGTGDNRYYGLDNNHHNERITYQAAHTYGPYVLEDAFEYLKRKRVLALIVLGQLWVMLYRAFATPIGIPAKAQLAVLVAVKICPFVVYAFAKKKVVAATSSCILVVMPILIELVTEADRSTHEGDNRSLWTGFFPLMVLVVDRFFLAAMNLTSHPSRSVGALIIYCTMHAFFIQNMLLGILLTIKASEHAGLVAGYAICFAIIEIILNTVLVERLVYSLWKRIKSTFSSGASAKKTLVDPLGKYSIANVAAMVRLPTLILSFIFMLPAMHFEYYPQKTRAIGCDGKTNYHTSWPTYGIIAGVIFVVGAVTCAMRKRHGTSLVPLCVYGIGWSLMVSFYCLQVVPQSLSFLPLIGGSEDR